MMIFHANSEEPTLRCHEDLSELTKKTLALLREGLQQRFFHRHHLIYASTKKLPIGWDQQKLAQEHLKNIKHVAWQRARQLAVQHITPNADAREQPTTSSRTSNTAQGCRTHKRKYQRFNPDLVSEDSNSNLPKASIGSVHENFYAEMHR